MQTHHRQIKSLQFLLQSVLKALEEIPDDNLSKRL